MRRNSKIFRQWQTDCHRKIRRDGRLVVIAKRDPALREMRRFKRIFNYGELAEWLNAAVLKTVKDVSPSGVRIPDSPPLKIKPH